MIDLVRWLVEDLEIGFGIPSWLVVVSPLCYSVDILLFSLRLVGSFWIVVQLVSRLWSVVVLCFRCWILALFD